MSALSQEIPCHHKKTELCFSRPAYRAPNKPNAVKVYTVSQESCYLMIQHVPAIDLGTQLARLLNNSSTLIRFEKINSIPCEEFTEVYLAKYSTLASARYVKKKYDDHSFYGSQLHLTYAPEQETADETCRKLEVYRRKACKILNGLSFQPSKSKEKTVLCNSFSHNFSNDSRSLQLGSIVSKNDNSTLTDKAVISDRLSNFPLQPIAKSSEVNTLRISLPANLNICSNPPTQQLFSKTSHFRPLPRQVKLRQIRAEGCVRRQESGKTESSSFDDNIKYKEYCHKQPSAKNLLISSELLNKAASQSFVDSDGVRVDSSSNAKVSKESKGKKRRRI